MGDYINLRIRYGGTFSVVSRRLRYDGGSQKLLRLDIDHLSYFELLDYVMEYGSYKSKDFYMYYKIPANGGMKLLGNDSDVIEMGKYLTSADATIDVYVQQGPISNPQSQPSQSEGQTTKEAQSQPSPLRSPISSLLTPSTSPRLGFTKSSAKRVEVSLSPSQTLKEKCVVDDKEKCVVETDNKERCVTETVEVEVETQISGGSDQEGTDIDDSEDETYRYGGSDDDVTSYESDGDDDEWRQSIATIHKVNREESESKKSVLKSCLQNKVEEGGGHLQGSSNLEAHSSYEDSEGDVRTPGESEDDDILGKKYTADVPVVNEHTDWNKFIWVVGTRFPSRDAFKQAVKNYAVANGKNLFISVSNKNRQGRVGINCVKGCPFNIYCSWHEEKRCYMVKKAVNKHNCQRNMKRNRQLTANFIANDFLPVFKCKPYWSAKEIQLAVKEKYKVLITKWLAYKAKSCAHKKLYGSMKEHYSKLGSYLEALRLANPTSSFELVTAPPGFINADSSSTCETFFRLFVCFDGLRKGFLDGCRRMLCLDGCFLKTFLGGMLLGAIGRDANDRMYPVAWAVVEGENNDSWVWFMEHLRRCFEINDGGKGWTLISDQQKGLLNAVALVWPEAEHRNCARHIYANWHKKHKSGELKEVFWKAVRAYNEPEYKEALKEMKELSADAEEAFLKQNPKCFSRCFLSTHTKCDVVVNNMAETFNGYIIQSRSKHIISMLEDIRVAMMTRMTTMHSVMANEDVVVCPRIQDKVDKEKGYAYRCEVYPSSFNVFQVREIDDVSVDLVNKTCTCRKWDLTGIPCKHVCAVAGFLNKNAEEFVNECYHKGQFMKSYAFTIPPLASEKFWPTVDYPLDPPPIKAQPGRPKKNRKRDPHENPKNPGKLTRHGTEMTCSNCKGKGHNKRGCGSQKRPRGQETRLNNPRGRPKKVRVAASQSSQQASQLTQDSSQQPKSTTRKSTRKGKSKEKAAS